MPTIQIDSIKIPDKFVKLASQWYSGQSDMLYAVASTGGLTLGSIQPTNCDNEYEWYVSLWSDLSCDLSYACRAAEKYLVPNVKTQAHIEAKRLRRFAKFVDDTYAKLREDYADKLGENWK